MIVVDVSRADLHCLSGFRGIGVLEVVIPDSDVDVLTVTNHGRDTVSGSQDPLSPDQSTTTQVLVLVVDESDLPAPLARK